ncbi:programmed cell death protein 6-like isoform X2 [Dendronephthya gigantea]|uniref:programmed cell death protein 6-like isoform X2 n=1 Tax=Dendronephthya gigantea TaxID=151771 RepID=UPI00106A6E99|nr:programmed cell death protein 6-like isoform X2 [Dendronephthya gigantea]
MARVDKEFLKNMFSRIDKDKNGSISADELQQALGNGAWTAFNPETIRLMIGMFDTDGNGVIDFNEFAALWQYVSDWQNTFRSFDLDNSGTIDRNELKAALQSFERFYGILIRKFDRSGSGDIRFDDFIQCCVVLKTLTNAFKYHDRNLNGWITVTYEQFLTMVFNCKMKTVEK